MIEVEKGSPADGSRDMQFNRDSWSEFVQGINRLRAEIGFGADAGL